jgi:hypothetical protein
MPLVDSPSAASFSLLLLLPILSLLLLLASGPTTFLDPGCPLDGPAAAGWLLLLLLLFTSDE